LLVVFFRLIGRIYTTLQERVKTEMESASIVAQRKLLKQVVCVFSVDTNMNCTPCFADRTLPTETPTEESKNKHKTEIASKTGRTSNLWKDDTERSSTAATGRARARAREEAGRGGAFN
jgi:hypothetical protein